MDSYNKTNLNIAALIATISIIFGLGGWWLSNEYFYINTSFIILGLTGIYFSHDLAMERVVKYKLGYKYARGAYIIIGLIFVLANIVSILNSYGLL